MARQKEHRIHGSRTISKTVAAQTVLSSSHEQTTIDTRGVQRIFVQLTVATAALTAFLIKAKPTGAASAFETLYSSSGDFITPTGILVGASGDLTTNGTGTGWFIMDVAGIDEISLFAKSGGTATLALEIGGF